MSERIYRCLLRLFPSKFREQYGDAAVELFRDRSRDETGFFKQLRLWCDLIADMCVSMPQMYRHARAGSRATLSQGQLDRVPAFAITEGRSLNAGPLVVGGLLSATMIVGVWFWSVKLNQHVVCIGITPHSRSTFLGLFKPAVSEDQIWEKVNGPRTGRPWPDTGFLQSVSYGSEKPEWVPISLFGQGRSSQSESPELTAAERHQVIAGVIASLTQYYVYPDLAKLMINALQDHEKRGDYDTITNGHEFANALTRDLRAVSHDGHLAVRYGPFGMPGNAPRPSSQPTRQDECAIEKSAILPHNIGYVKLNAFVDAPVCRSLLANTMQRLNHVSAIIFDIRDNGGGSPVMVAFVASYLFDRPTHLTDIYNRQNNTTRQSWTVSPITGNLLAGRPVYVLTSGRTFSGAEEFAYALKNLKRATIVGEKTGGGAHLVSPHPIGDHFVIGVPFGRPIDPITKTDWEGTGVQPDIPVKADDALSVAQQLASRHSDSRKTPTR